MKIIIFLLASFLFAENWTADNSVTRGDTLFVYTDKYYKTYNSEGYFQIGNQKYLWHRPYAFEGRNFAVKDNSENTAAFYPYKLLELEGQPIDTINTWGLYHEGVERAQKEGIAGMPIREVSYYDSFLVVELGLANSNLLKDFGKVQELMTALGACIYKRFTRDLFEKLVYAQGRFGDSHVYLDREQDFIDPEDYYSHVGSGVRLFNTASFTPEGKYPFAAYLIFETNNVVCIIPTIHPLAPLQFSSNPCRNLLNGMFAEGTVTIMPTAVGKEIRKMTREDVKRLSPKTRSRNVIPKLASSNGTWEDIGAPSLAYDYLLAYLRDQRNK